jgi:murein DD-endopeptidase MepM/ murein hydrolase activator NlpD
MSVFKGKNWIGKVQLQDFAAAIKNNKIANSALSWLNTYKYHCLKAIGAAGLLVTISVGGNHYVKTNTHEVFHVYVDGRETGVVSDPSVVESFIIEKYKQLEEQYPGVHMVLDTDGITYAPERAFKAVSADDDALKKLDGLLKAKALGVELKIDGKTVAILRNREIANGILDRMKNKYLPLQPEKGQVSILSAEPSEDVKAKTSLESIDFVQDVQIEVKEIQLNEIVEPEQLLHKLETGDVQPVKYIVQDGDCVSCIAKKLGIAKSVIYDNNPWIVDDMIYPGDELDLTVLEPTLSVKTVEKFVEDEEIQHDTIYHKDPEMRAGRVKIISNGKNGLKKVTYHLIKVNGRVTDEQLIKEEILVEPVSAVAKKGTKVIQGEGTGKFSWPVIGARLTSSFGLRWGRPHKGIDIASSNRSILASDNGKVVYAGWKNGYGKVIIIDHLNGYRTLYAHLSKIQVASGKIVEKGEKIGIMGNTGESYGVHLHFEVLRNGVAYNPMRYLNR